MGRWAQQARRGGGGSIPPTVLITQMSSAEIIASDTIQITLSAPVLSVPFVANDHSDLDSGGNSIAYGFISPGVFSVQFDATVDDGDSILYSAAHTGYATPQSLTANA